MNIVLKFMTGTETFSTSLERKANETGSFIIPNVCQWTSQDIWWYVTHIIIEYKYLNWMEGFSVSLELKVAI